MGALLGLLGISETDVSFVARLGQQMIYDTINEYLQMHTAEVDAQERVFVVGTTTKAQLAYRLPASGEMEQLGGQAEPAATKITGSWTVGFPIRDFGAALLKDDVTMAKMSPAELEAHVDGIRAQDINTRRNNVLRALFTNASRTFKDDELGDITVHPLANGDATLYPPTVGSSAEAVRQRYEVSNYAASAIDSDHNPIEKIVDALEDDFGVSTGGSNIAVFINRAQRKKVEALPDFDRVIDTHIRAGANTDIPVNLPNVPGTIRGRCNGSWIVEYPRIPSGYLAGIHLDAPAPLMRRIDTPNVLANLGMSAGLTLKAKQVSSPLETAIYRNRYGYGCANRLNGYIIQLKASGSYDIPNFS